MIKALATVGTVMALLGVCDIRVGAASPAGMAVAHRLIDVPYISQAQEPAAGAALTMVLRYWGDRSVVPLDFASLATSSERGVAPSDVVDAVTSRGWQAIASQGTSSPPLAELQREVDQGRPVIALLESAPDRWRYVVIVGVTSASVVMHDPTSTAFSVLPKGDFDREWQGGNRWRLVVLPPAAAPPAARHATTGACGGLVNHAAAMSETDKASEISLDAARDLCPESGSRLLALATLKFKASSWHDAARLAARAAELEPQSTNAWTLLAEARFKHGDYDGALEAWNHLEQPMLDAIKMSGATTTPEPVMEQLMRLAPGTLLTRADFELARRGLSDTPAASNSHVTFTPVSGGKTNIAASIDEIARYPRSVGSLAVIGSRVIFAHELRVDMAGLAGRGDLFTGVWRWIGARPHVGATFVIPVRTPVGGVATVDAYWDAQSYAVPITSGSSLARIERDDRARVIADLGKWLTGYTRIEGGAGLDHLSAANFMASHAAMEERLLDGRLAARAAVELWSLGGDSFWTHDLAFWWRSTSELMDNAWVVFAGDSWASGGAPRALWMGAGTGQGRPMLLRAHPLLTDDVVTSRTFGRHLAYGTTEWVHPIRQVLTGTIGYSLFVDAARAWHGLDETVSPFEVDLGVGLRLRLPESNGSVRVDLASGLRDGHWAFSVGWTPTAWLNFKRGTGR